MLEKSPEKLAGRAFRFNLPYDLLNKGNGQLSLQKRQELLESGIRLSAPKCEGCIALKIDTHEDRVSDRRVYTVSCGGNENYYLIRCPDGDKFERRGDKYKKVEPVKIWVEENEIIKDRFEKEYLTSFESHKVNGLLDGTKVPISPFGKPTLFFNTESPSKLDVPTTTVSDAW